SIRVAVAYSQGRIDPHVLTGVQRAAGWLKEAGYEVVEAEPPRIDEAAAAWFAAIWAGVGDRWPTMRSMLGSEGLTFLDAGLAEGVCKSVDRTAQQMIWPTVHEIGAAWAQFFESYPVILAPICTEPAWRIDEDVIRIRDFSSIVRMVVPINILGLPSCAVPVG